MQNELDIVRDVSTRLNGAGIAYTLTSSMAMNYYAQPRMTRDIDVVAALTPADAGTVVDLFSRNYYVSEDFLRQNGYGGRASNGREDRKPIRCGWRNDRVALCYN